MLTTPTIFISKIVIKRFHTDPVSYKYFTGILIWRQWVAVEQIYFGNKAVEIPIKSK